MTWAVSYPGSILQLGCTRCRYVLDSSQGHTPIKSSRSRRNGHKTPNAGVTGLKRPEAGVIGHSRPEPFSDCSFMAVSLSDW